MTTELDIEGLKSTRDPAQQPDALAHPETSRHADGLKASALNPCHPDNVAMGVSGGYIGHALARRVQNALLSDAWLATSANAYEVEARSLIDQARELVLDRPYRHKRKAAYLARANRAALHASAFRELLRFRQSLARDLRALEANAEAEGSSRDHAPSDDGASVANAPLQLGEGR